MNQYKVAVVLRTILAYLDVPTLGQPEAFLHAKDGFFDAAGGVGSADTKSFSRPG